MIGLKRTTTINEVTGRGCQGWRIDRRDRPLMDSFWQAVFRPRKTKAARLIVATAMSLAISATVVGCATGSSDSAPASSSPSTQVSTSPSSPVNSGKPPGTSPGPIKPVPQQPTLTQPPQPNLPQPQPQPQQPTPPRAEESTDPVPAEPPSISVTYVRALGFISPTTTVTILMKVTSTVGVSYLNVKFVSPKGEWLQSAFLTSGTPVSGTWTSNSTVQCSQFRAGANLTVLAEAGDLNGAVTQADGATATIGYGATILPYDPVTNTAGSRAYTCP